MEKIALAFALALPALAGPQPAEPPASTPAAPRAGEKAEPPPSARAPLPRGAVLEEVSGTVREIDRKVYRLSVETPKGPVSLTLDRNTMVYTATGLGTMLDLAPGQQIRAGRNADFLAYWVQVRAPIKASPTSPAQGTGPAGSAAAPAGESTTGPGAGPAPGGPGSVPTGTPQPGGAQPGP